MEAGELRHLEIRSRALQLEVRTRRVELGKISAAVKDANEKLHRSSERFSQIKHQLWSVGQTKAGSPVETLHNARTVAAHMAEAAKTMRYESEVLTALEGKLQDAQQLVALGERQLARLDERSQAVLQRIVVGKESAQLEELVEVSAHKPGDVGSLHTTSRAEKAGDIANLEADDEVSEVRKVGSKDEECDTEESASISEIRTPGYDYRSTDLSSLQLMQISMDAQRQHSGHQQGQSQQHNHQSAVREAAGAPESTRSFREALSPAMEKKIAAFESWDRLSGQGVEFSVSLSSGNTLGVEISGAPGGAVQVVLEPERNRDRHALWQQRTEIVEALEKAGCEVKQVVVRGRS